MGERIHKLEVRLTKDEIGEHITVDEWLESEEGNKRTIVNVMSRFMWLDGERLTPAEGRQRVGQLPLNQFNQMLDEFYRIVRESAVPNENGADSDAP